MKSYLFTLFLLTILETTYAQNVVKFTDPNFKAALVADHLFVNTNKNSEIEISEANSAAIIYIKKSFNITDLGGIEAFSNLAHLEIENNNIATIDLTSISSLIKVLVNNNNTQRIILPLSNTSLLHLSAENNQLTSIAWPATLPNLDSVILNNNLLTSLDLSAASQLKRLNCNGNLLTSLTLPATLRQVHIQNNLLTSLDLSAASQLKRLNCNGNLLTSLTLPSEATTNNILVEEVTCRNNSFTNLRFLHPVALIDCSENTNLDSLWVVGKNLGHERVFCKNSSLLYLDFDDKVDEIDCSYNQLTKIEVKMSDDLKFLNCSHNNIEELVLSINSPMKTLDCSHNLIDTLEVGCSNQFTDLDCSNNALKFLSIFNSSAFITNFDARNNPNLFCIASSDPAFGNANWTNIDPGVVVRDYGACQPIWNSTATLAPLSTVQVYPNPTDDQVQVDFGQQFPSVIIRIHNSIGQVVYEKEVAELQQTTLTLPKEKGFYFVQLQTEQGMRTFQVVKN